MRLYEFKGYEDDDPELCLWYYDFLIVSGMKFRNVIYEPTQYYPLIAC